MRAPVSACLITRDDPHLAKAVASIRPYVAEVCIVDTGSRESVVEQGECLADKFEVFAACNDAHGRMVDFAEARNASFELASEPWILWLDSDDLVHGGDRLAEVIREAEKAAAGKDVRVFAPYEYAYDYDGDCVVLQGRERLVNRGAWYWTRPVHEGLIPVDPDTAHVDIFTEKMVWKHQRQHNHGAWLGERDGGRNLRILLAQIGKGDGDARLHLDLGVEYSILAQVTNTDEEARNVLHVKARIALHTALNLNPMQVDEYRIRLELSEVALREAVVRTALQRKPFDADEATRNAFEALRLRSHWDVPNFAIARIAYMEAASGLLSDAQRQRAVQRAVHFAEVGLSMQPPPMPMVRCPLDRTLRAYEWLHDGYARLGHFDKALEYVETALRTKPLAVHLRQARREYTAALSRNRVVVDLKRMHMVGALDDALYEVVLSALDDPRGLKRRLRAMATGEQERPVPSLTQLAASVSGCPAMSIVFACGTTLEPWNPDILATRGIGGSETAVIEMAKRLAVRGHDVRVYCTCGDEMVRDGVRYLRAGKLFASEACDILVAWRSALLLEPEHGPVNARARVLWVHDVDPANMTIARGYLATRVFALSDWHRSHLMREHRLSGDQVVKTRNGVDFSRFGSLPERHPHRAVWSSSYDRGLAHLLDYWPEIRKRVPDAELHIFYGNTAHKAAAEFLSDAVMAKWIAETEEKIEALADQGVVQRGRLEQRELAKEFLSAGVLLYPTSFTETFCITAAEAQAAGLAIVTSAIAALPETVFHGVLLAGDPDSDTSLPNGQSYREAFIDAAEYAMGMDENERVSIMADARNSFDWDPVAEHWEVVFEDALLEAETGELAPYVCAMENAAE